MKYIKSNHIEGVKITKLEKFSDNRGWLSELFRVYDLPGINPVMCYASMTKPGIIRGPHEHEMQTDWFHFIGPSDFMLILWDARPYSESSGCKMELVVGESNPTSITVPPGVVHGYKNIGSVPGLVLNFPNKYYKGKDKECPVDEIRHENEENSPFKF